MTDHNYYYKTPNWTDGPDRGQAVPAGESWDLRGGDDEFNALGGNDRIWAGAGNDFVQGDTGDDSLYGQSGNDRLEGGHDNDLLDGGLGDDGLYGDSGNDKLYGGDGNDFLDGGTGLNYLEGGTGNDTYIVDDNGDSLYEAGGQGIDTVRSSIGYALGANVENLVLTEQAGSVNGAGNALANALTGNSYVNTLRGGDGDDVLNGGGGADFMVGGFGSDSYFVDNAADKVVEEFDYDGGTDTVYAYIPYVLPDHVENLRLEESSAAFDGTGNALNNYIIGNSAANTLRGEAGNDHLVGMAGNDVLDGSAGADTLVGGNGDDLFVFDTADLAPAGTRWFGQTGVDTIQLNGGDALDLSTLGDDRITGIEIVDMSAAGSSQLTIALTDVRAMSDNATVRVTGTSDDHVVASAGWVQGADMVFGDSLYHSFAAGGASLLIDTDVGMTLL